MAEINDLDVTDASNTARFPENQNPSTVNNGARALEGLLARWHKDINGSLIATGAANTLAVALNQTIPAYYDGLMVAAEVNATVTGAATLNAGAIGAKDIRKGFNSALAAGDLAAGQKAIFIFDAVNDWWQLISANANQVDAAAGPASSTDNGIARFNGTGGKTLQDSGIIIGDDDELSQFNALAVTDAAAARPLAAADNGAMIFFTSSSAVTVTLPETSTLALNAGFNCTIVQAGTGQITVVTEGSDTIESKSSSVKTTAQHSAIGVVKKSAGSQNVWWLGGDLSA